MSEAGQSEPQPSLAQVQFDASEHGSQSCPQLATATTFKANTMLKSAVRAIGPLCTARMRAALTRGLRSTVSAKLLKLYTLLSRKERDS